MLGNSDIWDAYDAAMFEGMGDGDIWDAYDEAMFEGMGFSLKKAVKSVAKKAAPVAKILPPVLAVRAATAVAKKLPAPIKAVAKFTPIGLQARALKAVVTKPKKTLKKVLKVAKKVAPFVAPVATLTTAAVVAPRKTLRKAKAAAKFAAKKAKAVVKSPVGQVAAAVLAPTVALPALVAAKAAKKIFFKKAPPEVAEATGETENVEVAPQVLEKIYDLPPGSVSESSASLTMAAERPPEEGGGAEDRGALAPTVGPAVEAVADQLVAKGMPPALVDALEDTTAKEVEGKILGLPKMAVYGLGAAGLLAGLYLVTRKQK